MLQNAANGRADCGPDGRSRRSNACPNAGKKRSNARDDASNRIGYCLPHRTGKCFDILSKPRQEGNDLRPVLFNYNNKIRHSKDNRRHHACNPVPVRRE